MVARFLVACLLILVLGRFCVAQIPVTVASPDALRVALSSEYRVETLPGNYLLVVPEPFAPPIRAIDPIYKNKTSRTLFLYETLGQAGRLMRRVTIHFEPDDRESAVHAAYQIARLMRLHRERFGRDTTFRRGSDQADVWFVPAISSNSTEGGETRDVNVYIFDAGAIKAPIELVRTVAHEWGHLTLPAARGYAEPESDAAGYLGERLYLKWFLEDNRTAYPDDNASLFNALSLYRDRQIKPLMLRWQEGGAASKQLSGDRTEAMDYYIGAVLDTDRAFGAKVAGDALFTITDTDPKDFLTALSSTISQYLEAGLTVELPAWIPLNAGNYEASNGGGELVLSGRKSLRILVGGGQVHSMSQTTGRFRISQSGWNKATAGPGFPQQTLPIGKVSLKSIPKTNEKRESTVNSKKPGL